MIDLKVSTDLEDYAPGSTAVITASGLPAGSTIKFEVDHTLGAGADGVWGTHDDVIATSTGAGHEPWYVTDGGAGDLDGLANGSITSTWYVDPDDSLGARFVLSAATAGSDGVFGTSDDAMATTTFTDSDAVSLTGASVTHDESAGLQNSIPATATEDNNDNDIAVGSLPSAFTTRLSNTVANGGLNAGTPTGAAVSGYTGTGSGSNAFTIDPAAGTVTDVRFVDALGAALNGLPSGKFTLSGVEVLLSRLQQSARQNSGMHQLNQGLGSAALKSL